MLKLISATPSPFARKVRIALVEKGLPFELITDVPWNDDTVVRDYNPLEKLPILLTESDGPIYDSALIVDYLDLAYPQAPLIPRPLRERLLAKTVEVLQNGVCDAVVLLFFERQRAPGQQSEAWIKRQQRKIERGTAEIARLVGDNEFIVANTFSLADIAAGCTLGYLSLRAPDFDWRGRHGNLVRYFGALSRRRSFAETIPTAQAITAKVA